MREDSDMPRSLSWKVGSSVSVPEDAEDGVFGSEAERGQQLGRAVEMGKLHLEINTVVSFQRLGCSSILSLETTCSRRFSTVIGPMLCLGGQVKLQRQVLKDWVP